MIRILIVDDHAIVRQGLRRILEEEKGIKVGGEAANGAEAIKLLRTEKFNVILLDISMPEKNGIDTMKQILERDGDAKILILSMYPEDQYAVRLMKAGASGYLTKETAPELLVDAIRNVVGGKKHISANLAELLLQECRVDTGKPLHLTLSDREYQVLRMIGSGKQVSEVAELLALSVKTVSTYRAHILEKMNLRNNAELTHYVMRNNLEER
jgi:two-component system, NarL family, invasion response regulator UvrY